MLGMAGYRASYASLEIPSLSMGEGLDGGEIRGPKPYMEVTQRTPFAGMTDPYSLAERLYRPGRLVEIVHESHV